MKFNKFIPNQQKELLKTQINKAEKEISDSNLESKEFLIALFSQLRKVV